MAYTLTVNGRQTAVDVSGPDGVEAGGELEAVATATGGAMFTVAMSEDRPLP
jgi:hypothetical protein